MSFELGLAKSDGEVVAAMLPGEQAKTKERECTEQDQTEGEKGFLLPKVPRDEQHNENCGNGKSQETVVPAVDAIATDRDFDRC